MEGLTYEVVMWNHGLQWLCKSTNFKHLGTGLIRPEVEGCCTVHTGFLSEMSARREMMKANA